MSTALFLFSLAITAAAATALIVWTLLATGWAQRLAVDVPNHRSLHARPTPRIGGWAVIPVIVIGMLIWARPLWPVTLAVLSVALLSYLDDRRGLSARIRFAAHALAVIVLLLTCPSPLAEWQWIITAFFLIGGINAYNFMDGADGLAGGMTVFGFSAYAAAAAHQAPDLAASAALIAGAAGGFLHFNWPPARVFLGDAGSIPLGFLAGAFGYIGMVRGLWSGAFPLMIFAPFILDTSITLCRRLLRGERFWQAHREHYYQRMIQMSTNLSENRSERTSGKEGLPERCPRDPRSGIGPWRPATSREQPAGNAPTPEQAPSRSDGACSALRGAAQEAEHIEICEHSEHRPTQHHARAVDLWTGSKGHAATVRTWYSIIALGAGLALVGLQMSVPAQWIMLILWLCALLIGGWKIDCR